MGLFDGITDFLGDVGGFISGGLGSLASGVGGFFGGPTAGGGPPPIAAQAPPAAAPGGFFSGLGDFVQEEIFPEIVNVGQDLLGTAVDAAKFRLGAEVQNLKGDIIEGITGLPLPGINPNVFPGPIDPANPLSGQPADPIPAPTGGLPGTGQQPASMGSVFRPTPPVGDFLERRLDAQEAQPGGIIDGFLSDLVVGSPNSAPSLPAFGDFVAPPIENAQQAGVGGLLSAGAGLVGAGVGALQTVDDFFPGGVTGAFDAARDFFGGFFDQEAAVANGMTIFQGGGGPVNTFHQTPTGNFVANGVGFQRTPVNPRTGKSKIIGYVAAEVSEASLKRHMRSEVLKKTRRRSRRRPR